MAENGKQQAPKARFSHGFRDPKRAKESNGDGYHKFIIVLDDKAFLVDQHLAEQVNKTHKKGKRRHHCH